MFSVTTRYIILSLHNFITPIWYCSLQSQLLKFKRNFSVHFCWVTICIGSKHPDYYTKTSDKNQLIAKKEKAQFSGVFMIIFTVLPYNCHQQSASNIHVAELGRKMLGLTLTMFHIFQQKTFLLSLLLAVQTTHSTNS